MSALYRKVRQMWGKLPAFAALVALVTSTLVAVEVPAIANAAIVTNNLLMNLDGTSSSSLPATGNWASVSPATGTYSGAISGAVRAGGTYGGLTFDGDLDYANFGTGAGAVTGSMTFEAWIKPGGMAANRWNIIASRWFDSPTVETAANHDWHFGINHNGTTANLQLDMTTQTAALRGTTSFPVTSANKWYHVGFVVDSTTGKAQIFVNGVADSSAATMSHNASTGPQFWIGDGRTVLSGPVAFTGQISKVRMYNAALTAAQLAQNFQSEADFYGLAPANTVAPKVSGIATVGKTLVTDGGTWGAGDSTGTTTSYQWQSSPSKSTWTNISGATSSSYTLASTYVGYYVRLAITKTNANGSATAYSNATNLVQSASALTVASGGKLTGLTSTVPNTSDVYNVTLASTDLSSTLLLGTTTGLTWIEGKASTASYMATSLTNAAPIVSFRGTGTAINTALANITYTATAGTNSTVKLYFAPGSTTATATQNYIPIYDNNQLTFHYYAYKWHATGKTRAEDDTILAGLSTTDTVLTPGPWYMVTMRYQVEWNRVSAIAGLNQTFMGALADAGSSNWYWPANTDGYSSATIFGTQSGTVVTATSTIFNGTNTTLPFHSGEPNGGTTGARVGFLYVVNNVLGWDDVPSTTTNTNFTMETYGTAPYGISGGLAAGSLAQDYHVASLSNAPTGLTATILGETASLAWTAPTTPGTDSIVDYKIDYSIDGTNWTNWVHDPSVATSASVTGLTPGVAYYFRVAAITSDIGTYSSSVLSIVTSTTINVVDTGGGIAGTDYAVNGTTISAKSGASVNITASAIQTLLATQSVNLAADTVNINAPLTWASNQTLTLGNGTSSTVSINKALSTSGTSAGLVIKSSTYSLDVKGGASIVLSGTSPTLSIGGNAYTLVKSTSDLGSVLATGYYALAKPIAYATDATALTAAPINLVFSGTFDGLGNTVDRMRMALTVSAWAGLFSRVGASSKVRNLGVTSGYISMAALSGGYSVGMIAGGSEGAGATMDQVWSSGLIKSLGSTTYIGAGGILGQAYSGTITITKAWSSVSIDTSLSGSTTQLGQGGIVGIDQYSYGVAATYSGGGVTLNQVYATGNFKWASTGHRGIGGLFGLHYQSSAAMSINDGFSWVTFGTTDSSNFGGILGVGNGTASTLNRTYQTTASVCYDGYSAGVTPTPACSTKQTMGATVSGLTTSVWTSSGATVLVNLPTPKKPLYVQVVAPTDGTYGSITYQLVDSYGTATTTSSLGVTLSGTPNYSIDTSTANGTYSVEYTGGLTLGGTNASIYTLERWPSATSVTISATTSSLMTAPTGLTATNAGSGAISLKWVRETGTESQATTSYQVRYSTSEYMNPSSTWTTANVTTGTLITGLTNGTLYYFQIRAIGSTTWKSLYSGTITATPSATATTINVVASNGGVAGTDFTINGGVISTTGTANVNVSDITALLATEGYVRLGADTVNINTDINWSSNNALVIGNTSTSTVNINAKLIGSGTSSKVTILPATYSLAVGSGAYIRLTGSSPVVWIGGTQFTVVNTSAGLSSVAAGTNWVLTAPIFLTSSSSTAIKDFAFTGIFDGFGNTIDGMSISSTANGNYGFFQALNGAKIRNVGLTNGYINIAISASGSVNAGLLAGNSTGTTTVDQVWTTGLIRSVSGSYTAAGFGGLIAIAPSGSLTINKSWSSASILTAGATYTSQAVGGILGTNCSSVGGGSNAAGGTIVMNEVYSTGALNYASTTNWRGIGGIMGLAYSTATTTLNDVFSWSTLSGNDVNFGGLVGVAQGGAATINRGYTTYSTVVASNYAAGLTQNTVSSGVTLGAAVSGLSTSAWSSTGVERLVNLASPKLPLFIQVVPPTDASYNTISYKYINGAGTQQTLSTLSLTESGTPVYSIASNVAVSATPYSVTYTNGLTVDGSNIGIYSISPWPVATSVTISKLSQSISFTSTAPTSAKVGTTYTVAATASSSLTVTFSIDSSTSSNCSISGTTVTFTAVGDCKINANQAGNASYSAATQVQQIATAAVKGDQTITFTSMALLPKVAGSTYTPTATTTSGQPAVFTIDAASSSICSITSGVVSFLAVGDCVIKANQSGNTSYNAATEVTQTATVGKGASTLTWTSTVPSNAVVAGATYTPVASKTAANTSSIVYSIDSSTSSICSIASGVVSFTGAGICKVNANLEADSQYEAASQIQQSITVGKGAQVITITSNAPNGAKVGGRNYTLTATGGGSTSAIVLSVDSSTSSKCSVSGMEVTWLAVGTCLLNVNQAGDANYNAAAQVQQYVTISSDGRCPNGVVSGNYCLIRFNTSGSWLVPAGVTTADILVVGGGGAGAGGVGGHFATGGGGGGEVIENLAKAVVPGTLLTVTVGAGGVGSGSTTAGTAGTAGGASSISGSGFTTITARGGGWGASYNVASSVAVPAATGSTYAGGGGAAAQVSSVAAGVGGVSTGGAGYTHSTDGNYQTGGGGGGAGGNGSAGTSTIAGAGGAGKASVILGVNLGGGGGGAKRFATNNGAGGSATAGGGTGGYGAAGTAGTANTGGGGGASAGSNNGGNGGSGVVVFRVSLQSQTVSFTSTAPTGLIYGTSTTYTPTVSGTASDANPVVTVDSTSTSVCSITAGVVSIIGAGTCTLNANQEANGFYSAANQVQQSFTVAKSDQTISFTSTASSPKVNTTYTPTATSTSGGSVNFTLSLASIADGICSISNGVVTFNKVGTCTILGDSAASTNWNAATQGSQAITVIKGDQTISFTSSASTPKVNSTYTPTATSTSGGSVTFTLSLASIADGICSISNGVVTFNKVGTCTILGDSAASTNWNAATQGSQAITVIKGDQTLTWTAATAIPFKNGTFTPSALPTGSDSPSISYSVTAAGATGCTVNSTSGVVTYVSAGSCEVTASATTTTNFNAATTKLTFVIAAAPVITVVTSGGGVLGTDYVLADGLLSAAANVSVNASEIESALNLGSVQIAGAVVLNAPISWSGNTVLTLGGTSSNAVTLNKSIAASGNTAGLVIKPTTYTLATKSEAAISLSGTNPTLTIGGNSYTLIKSVADLQNVTAAAADKFALAVPLTFTSGVTASPIAVAFAGTFDGLGNTIDKVSITHTANGSTGFFKNLAGGTIRNLGITNEIISLEPGSTGYNSNVGGLVGDSSGGTIDRVWTTGFMRVKSGSSYSGLILGGLVGDVYSGTVSISKSWSSMNMDAWYSTYTNQVIGGLVGADISSWTATSASASGNVYIDQSFYTGDIQSPQVSGITGLGGLMGAHLGVGNGTPPVAGRPVSITNSFSWPGIYIATGGNYGGIIATAAGTAAYFYTTYTNQNKLYFTGANVNAASNSSWSVAFGGTPGFTTNSNFYASANGYALVNMPLPYKNKYVRVVAPTDGSYSSITYRLVNGIDTTQNATGLYTITGTPTYTIASDAAISATPYKVDYSSGLTFTYIGSGTNVYRVSNFGFPTSVTISKYSQSISLTSTAPTAAAVGTTYSLVGSASSDLAISYTIDTGSTSVCSISGSTVTFNAIGSCVINANQSGNASYLAAAQVQQTATVTAKGSQTISFSTTVPNDAKVGGNTYSVSATGGSSTGSIAYAIDNSSSAVCSISIATVSFLAKGTCVVTAVKAGDSNWNATPVISQTIAVAEGDQSITFTSSIPNDAKVGGSTYTVSATGGAATTSVVFSVPNSSAAICSIEGAVVSFLAAGDCVIAANQAGDTNWNAASEVTQTISVGKGTQVILFTSTIPTDAVVDGTTYAVSAVGGPSGNAINYTVASGSSSICAINGSTVSFIGAGTCELEANQAGNNDWNAASQVTQSITVGKGSQSTYFDPSTPTNVTLLDSGFDLVATGGNAQTNHTFTIAPASTTVCSVSGQHVTYLTVGDCVVELGKAGDDNYLDAPVISHTITIGYAAQEITWTSTTPTEVKVDGTGFTPSATVQSGEPVVFTIDSQSSSVCSISNGVVTYQHVGECVINANEDGNSTYSAAPQSQLTLNVGRGEQTITFSSAAPTDAKVSGASYTPAATGGATGHAVTFRINLNSSSVCKLTSGVVSFIGVGTCTIDANQVGNADYQNAATAQQSFTVVKGNQVILFTSTAPSSAVVGGARYLPTAVGGLTGNAVTFAVASGSASVCEFISGRVKFNAPGDCVIEANQAGNTNYEAAPTVSQTISVAKGDQTVAFTSSFTNAKVGGASYQPVATGGSSGNAVTFSVASNSSAICTVTAGVVTFDAVGSCVIEANQAGDSNWNAAPTVTQTLTVTKGTQAVMFTSTPPHNAQVQGLTYTPSAVGTNSGIAVVYSVPAEAQQYCTISNGVVSFHSVGDCVLYVNQPGNSNWNAASQVAQIFDVTKGQQVVTISSSAPDDAKVAGATYTVSATGGAGTAPVTLSVSPLATEICSVNGMTVSFNSPGECVILASQAGDANFNAANPVAQTIQVAKGVQSISFTSTPTNPKVDGAAYLPQVTTGGSSASVIFTTASDAVCEVAAGVVYFHQATDCVVYANQAGDSRFEAAAQISQTITVAIGDQIPLAWNLSTPSLVLGGSTDPTSVLSVSGGSGTGAYSWAVAQASSQICSITDDVITGYAVGYCGIELLRSGDSNYNPQTASFEISISAGNQAPVRTRVSNEAPSYSPGLELTLSLDGGAGQGAVWYESLTPHTCNTDGGTTLQILHAGQCQVVGHKDGDDNYQGTFDTLTFTIAKAVQSQVSVSTAEQMRYSSTGSTSAELVVTGVLSTGIQTLGVTMGSCTIEGGNLVATEAGDCVVRIQVDADENYEAIDQTTTISVAKAQQSNLTASRSVDSPAQIGYQGVTQTSYDLSGGSGRGFITLTSSTPAKCSANMMDGRVVITGLAAGACSVVIEKEAELNYDAATTTINLTVLELAAAPTEFTLTNTGESTSDGMQVRIGWTPAEVASARAAASGYKIQLKVDGTWTTINGGLVAAGQTSLLTSLAPWTKVEMRIAAVSAIDPSDDSLLNWKAFSTVTSGVTTNQFAIPGDLQLISTSLAAVTSGEIVTLTGTGFETGVTSFVQLSSSSAVFTAAGIHAAAAAPVNSVRVPATVLSPTQLTFVLPKIKLPTGSTFLNTTVRVLSVDGISSEPADFKYIPAKLKQTLSVAPALPATLPNLNVGAANLVTSAVITNVVPVNTSGAIAPDPTITTSPAGICSAALNADKKLVVRPIAAGKCTITVAAPATPGLLAGVTKTTSITIMDYRTPGWIVALREVRVDGTFGDPSIYTQAGTMLTPGEFNVQIGTDPVELQVGFQPRQGTTLVTVLAADEAAGRCTADPGDAVTNNGLGSITISDLGDCHVTISQPADVGWYLGETINVVIHATARTTPVVDNGEATPATTEDLLGVLDPKDPDDPETPPVALDLDPTRAGDYSFGSEDGLMYDPLTGKLNVRSRTPLVGTWTATLTGIWTTPLGSDNKPKMWFKIPGKIVKKVQTYTFANVCKLTLTVKKDPKLKKKVTRIVGAGCLLSDAGKAALTSLGIQKIKVKYKRIRQYAKTGLSYVKVKGNRVLKNINRTWVIRVGRRS